MPALKSLGNVIAAGQSLAIQTNDYATLQVFCPNNGDGPNVTCRVQNLDGTTGPLLLAWQVNATGIGTPASQASGAIYNQIATSFDVSGLITIMLTNSGGSPVTVDYGLVDSKLNIPVSVSGFLPNPLPVTFTQPISVQGTNNYSQAIGVGGRDTVSGNFEVFNNWQGNNIVSDIVWQAPTSFPLSVAGSGGTYQYGQASIADDYEDRQYGVIDVTLTTGTILIQGLTILSPNPVNMIIKRMDGTVVPGSLIKTSGLYYFNASAMAAIKLTNAGATAVTVNYIGQSTGDVGFFLNDSAYPATQQALTGLTTATNTAVTAPVSSKGYTSASIAILSVGGSLTAATAALQISYDGGTTWYALNVTVTAATLAAGSTIASYVVLGAAVAVQGATFRVVTSTVTLGGASSFTVNVTLG